MVECVWDYRKVFTAIQNPKFDMILADWSSVQPGDGSAHDSSSPTRRQKTKATPRGGSRPNFLKAIQSLEVQTPVVFMHFKEELDEVKSMLMETIVKDGRKKRYYLMTKPLQVALPGNNLSISSQHGCTFRTLILSFKCSGHTLLSYTFILSIASARIAHFKFQQCVQDD